MLQRSVSGPNRVRKAGNSLLRLKITVDDPLRVHMLDGGEKLGGVEPGARQGEGTELRAEGSVERSKGRGKQHALS